MKGGNLGKRGPAPKPSALKSLGPRKHSKQNKKEPKPETSVPSCPNWLDRRAKWAFKELSKVLSDIHVLTVADRMALEILCDAYSEYREARQFIFDNGFTYTTITQAGDKMVRPYPQVAISQNAWRRVSDMLKQFGLTPSARNGVEALKPEEEDPFEAFLKQGVN